MPLGASDEQVPVGRRRAGADAFIRALSRGLRPLRSGHSSPVSGGQRSVLSALGPCQDAPVCVLVRGDVALAPATETEVLGRSGERPAIARRLLVYAPPLRGRPADRVIVLEGGRIGRTGARSELAAIRAVQALSSTPRTAGRCCR